MLQALREFAKNYFQLEAREVRPEAKVLAYSKCQMRIRIAPDIKLERFLEHVFVAISRWIEQAHRLPCSNFLPANSGVPSRSARELNDRGGPPHYFLDRRPDDSRLPLEATELIGVFDQCQQAAGGRVAGSLVAGHYQQEQVGQQLEHGQRRSVDLRICHDTGDVVGWMLLALGDQVAEVLKDFHPRLRKRISWVLAALELRIATADDLVGPPEQAWPIGARHSQHLGDHRDRDPR